jgi:hypothetical protein
MEFQMQDLIARTGRHIAMVLLLLLTFSAPGLASTFAVKCTPNAANVPQIAVDGHPDWTTVYNFAWANWKRLILSNTKMYNKCWIDEGFGAGGATWQWDTSFGTLGARWAYQEFPAIETQENFYDAQSANGFIGQKLSEQGETWKASSLNPPILAWVEWEYYLMSGDASHFTKLINGKTVLQHLVDYFYYFWNSSANHTADGYWVWSGIDSGRDCVSAGLWVDLPAQMATAAHYIAQIAGVVGNTKLQAEMVAKHDALASMLNGHHWNGARGIYENLNNDANKSFMTDRDGPQGLWTLVGRVPSPTQVDAMIARIQNDMSPYHPVPSVATSSPYYSSGCKWYGPTWPPDVIQTVKGLVAQERMQAAFEIAKQDVIATVATFNVNLGHLCESYQSTQPACYGNTDLTWSSAAFVVSLLDVVLGLAPDAPNHSLSWTINLTEAYSVSNLRFGAHTVSLASAARSSSSSGARLKVITDRAFTLTVKVAGTVCTQSVSAPVSPATTATLNFDCGTWN